jgi:hypothetical protein
VGASRRAHAACVLCRLACASTWQFQSHIEYDGPHLRGMPAQGVRGQVSMSVDTCGRRCLLSRSQQAPLRHTRARPCKATRSDQRANKRTLRRTLSPSADTRAGVALVYLHRRPCKPARESADGGDAVLTPFEKSLCSRADPSLWPRQIKEKNIKAAVDSNEGSVLESLCRFQDRA